LVLDIYADDTGKLPPSVDGVDSNRWYESKYVGRYLPSPIKKYVKASDRNYEVPPRGSVIACRSATVDFTDGHASKPQASWIGYNGDLSQSGYKANEDDDYAKYKLARYADVTKPLSQVVAFADSSSYGFWQVSLYANNNGTWYSGIPDYNWNPRHSGGANYGFLDGHATYFSDCTKAYFDKLMYQSPDAEYPQK
jgi:prepilin-type processing-associated H-X9-DG protein